MHSYSMFKNILIFVCVIFVFFLLFNFINLKEGIDDALASNTCPPPLIATNPDENIFNTLLINNFMSYAERIIQQSNTDLDSISTLISGTTFNLIVDPSNIADVSDNKYLPIPIVTMDSSNPPNYGIAIKLPKGREGPVGPPGNNGLTGPTGPTGSNGPEGSSGKWLLNL